MKKLAAIFLAVAAVLACIEASAQQKDVKQWYILHYIVENGDTTYIDHIRPCYKYAYGKKMSKASWRKYARLVSNFNAVYPYALMGRHLVNEVDSTLAAGGMTKAERKKYINSMQNELLKEFKPILKRMSISRGQLLVRLVDREIGRSSYEIVKDYKSGFAAGFWQGVAKIFNQDLKSRYDPEGKDKATEQLVRAWDSGEFDYLYYSVFGKWPEHTYIPVQFR